MAAFGRVALRGLRTLKTQAKIHALGHEKSPANMRVLVRFMRTNRQLTYLGFDHGLYHPGFGLDPTRKFRDCLSK